MPQWDLLLLIVCSITTMFFLKRLGTKKHYQLALDLTSPDVWSTQLKYALDYEQKSKLPKTLFWFFGGLLWTLIGLKSFGLEKIEESVVGNIFFWVAGGSIFLILPITYIKARCPKCNELQPAPTFRIGSFGLGSPYSFSPFAWRCAACECYLSTKLLYEDLEKQKKSQECTPTSTTKKP